MMESTSFFSFLRWVEPTTFWIEPPPFRLRENFRSMVEDLRTPARSHRGSEAGESPAFVGAFWKSRSVVSTPMAGLYLKRGGYMTSWGVYESGLDFLPE